MTFVMSKGCGGYGHGERTDTTSCLTRASLSRPNLIKRRCNIDEDGFEEAASVMRFVADPAGLRHEGQQHGQISHFIFRKRVSSATEVYTVIRTYGGSVAGSRTSTLL